MQSIGLGVCHNVRFAAHTEHAFIQLNEQQRAQGFPATALLLRCGQTANRNQRK